MNVREETKLVANLVEGDNVKGYGFLGFVNHRKGELTHVDRHAGSGRYDRWLPESTVTVLVEEPEGYAVTLEIDGPPPPIGKACRLSWYMPEGVTYGAVTKVEPV